MSSTATIDPQVPPKPASGALQIAAATVGNALEWFDILVYAYFAPYIASAFFPNSNPAVSLLLTFGSFGLSYGARPIGAVVLGAYADRSGRKAAGGPVSCSFVMGGPRLVQSPQLRGGLWRAPLRLALCMRTR